MENSLKWMDIDGSSIIETILAKSTRVFVLVAIPRGFVTPINVSLSQQKRPNIEACKRSFLHLHIPTHQHTMHHR
jgi:hypothetical protein